MQKTFLHKLDYIKFIILLFIINSCTSTKELINNNYTFKEDQKLQDTNIYKNLDEYLKLEEHKKTEKGLIIICSRLNLYDKNVKNYYFSKIMNLREIYDLPCSGYIIYKNNIILTYSKEIGYINPVNYPKKFLKKVNSYLVDDWSLKIKDCKDNVFTLDQTLISNHSTSYLVKDNRISVLKYNAFNLGEICFNEKNYAYTNYVNLDNFRTIYLEDCN